jgi:hypothetical protein
MGLLDDAIREHLDLKRRRGADPTEVERAEREALGPVRRGPEQPGLDEAGADHENGHGYVDGDGPEWDKSWEEAPEGEPAAEPEAFSEPPEALGEPPEASAEPPEVVTEPPAFEPPEPQSTPEPHPAPAPPPASHEQEPEPHDPGEETAEYDVESALEHEPEHEHEHDPEKKSDDVLEETPEFLQDTPDHDRLWFEQRPPRDFDFDG